MITIKPSYADYVSQMLWSYYNSPPDQKRSDSDNYKACDTVLSALPPDQQQLARTINIPQWYDYPARKLQAQHVAEQSGKPIKDIWKSYHNIVWRIAKQRGLT